MFSACTDLHVQTLKHICSYYLSSIFIAVRGYQDHLFDIRKDFSLGIQAAFWKTFIGETNASLPAALTEIQQNT